MFLVIFQNVLFAILKLQSHMYIPLCAKPAMAKLFREKPQLLEEAILQCLSTTKAQVTPSKLVVFVADGDVMAKVCLLEIFINLIAKILLLYRL